MKVCLILPGNIWFSPYVKIYTQVLEDLSVKYDIISWNRDGNDPEIGFQYASTNDSDSRISKLLPYIKYIKFIKKIVLENKYDRLIIFGPQLAIFLNKFLSKSYYKKFIFDYRDVSIEQKWYLKSAFQNVLSSSYANFISSPGFKRCLPDKYDYHLSHNFDINLVKKALANQIKNNFSVDKKVILTIGGIRDYSSNIEIVKALANNQDYQLKFVGRGSASILIRNYVQKHKITNVTFEGYYPKEKEPDYILGSTFVNIFYPKILSHETALSNRFYNSLIYKKPMIVTADSIQGDLVEKYNLGLSLINCQNLSIKIDNYLKSFNQELFNNRCNELLNKFISDYEEMFHIVDLFVSSR